MTSWIVPSSPVDGGSAKEGAYGLFSSFVGPAHSRRGAITLVRPAGGVPLGSPPGRRLKTKRCPEQCNVPGRGANQPMRVAKGKRLAS